MPTTIPAASSNPKASIRVAWSRSCCPPGGSGQLRNTDPVHPFPNRDLRVLAVAESAAEDTGTVLPLHLSPGRKVGVIRAWISSARRVFRWLAYTTRRREIVLCRTYAAPKA